MAARSADVGCWVGVGRGEERSDGGGGRGDVTGERAVRAVHVALLPGCDKAARKRGIDVEERWASGQRSGVALLVGGGGVVGGAV